MIIQNENKMKTSQNNMKMDNYKWNKKLIKDRNKRKFLVQIMKNKIWCNKKNENRSVTQKIKEKKNEIRQK